MDTRGTAHDHPHAPGHDGHEHDGHGDHGHARAAGRWARARHELRHLLVPHGHDAMDKVDSAVETSR